LDIGRRFVPLHRAEILRWQAFALRRLALPHDDRGERPLKAPPSRTEREKDGVPAFLCCEGLGLTLESRRGRSGALVAPIANFLEALATALLEEADTMADVLKFMNIGPHFSLPVFVMNGGFSAGGAARVKLSDYGTGWGLASHGQFDEDAANFLDVFVGVDDVLVAQEKAES